LRVAHLRRGNHLHGLGDLADVFDGADALLDCGGRQAGAKGATRRCSNVRACYRAPDRCPGALILATPWQRDPNAVITGSPACEEA
jgi:hypothetical protein